MKQDQSGPRPGVRSDAPIMHQTVHGAREPAIHHAARRFSHRRQTGLRADATNQERKVPEDLSEKPPASGVAAPGLAANDDSW